MKKLSAPILLICMFASYSSALVLQQNRPDQFGKIEDSLKNDIPRVLCINEKIATGGQPSDQAFAKLAAGGFRSVLNMRQSSEIDVEKERSLVEKAGMKFVNVPVTTSAPESERVVEFIKAVKDESNHPMLIHCGSANRVGAFWMIYLAIDEGLPEDKALAEAEKIGLTNPGLKAFAQNYIAQHKKK